MNQRMKFKAVIFDLDGTLIDSPLDFDAIRKEIGLPFRADILEHLGTRSEPERAQALAILTEHEKRAAGQARLCQGAREVLAALKVRGIKTALLTRNSSESVKAIRETLGFDFEAEATRDTDTPKPSPEGILRLARELGVEPEEILMVGDYLFDMQAGKAAGTATAFIRNKYDPPPEADHVLEKLADLLPLIG